MSFALGASPANLPGGNTLINPFVTTAGFSANSAPPILANGVNTASEWVNIRFNLIAGQTFADVIAALNSGVDLRIGIHVQGQGTGQSNSYVTLIPLPTGLWAGAAGFAGLAGMAWLRNRSLKA